MAYNRTKRRKECNRRESVVFPQTASTIIGDFQLSCAHNTWWKTRPIELLCRLRSSQVPSLVAATAPFELLANSCGSAKIEKRKGD